MLTDAQKEQLVEHEFPKFSQNNFALSHDKRALVEDAEIALLVTLFDYPRGSIRGTLVQDAPRLLKRAELAMAYINAGIAEGGTSADVLVNRFTDGAYDAIDKVAGSQGQQLH